MTANRFHFRMWFKPNWRDPEMYYEVEKTYDNMMGSDHHESFSDVLNDKDCIVMQSTGLTDKNGKEIYEGDILTDGSIKYLVKFDEERAWFIMQPILCKKTLLTDYEELGKRYMHYYEIIGNIYENKELLGK